MAMTLEEAVAEAQAQGLGTSQQAIQQVVDADRAATATTSPIVTPPPPPPPPSPPSQTFEDYVAAETAKSQAIVEAGHPTYVAPPTPPQSVAPGTVDLRDVSNDQLWDIVKEGSGNEYYSPVLSELSNRQNEASLARAMGEEYSVSAMSYEGAIKPIEIYAGSTISQGQYDRLKNLGYEDQSIKQLLALKNISTKTTLSGKQQEYTKAYESGVFETPTNEISWMDPKSVLQKSLESYGFKELKPYVTEDGEGINISDALKGGVQEERLSELYPKEVLSSYIALNDYYDPETEIYDVVSAESEGVSKEDIINVVGDDNYNLYKTVEKFKDYANKDGNYNIVNAINDKNITKEDIMTVFGEDTYNETIKFIGEHRQHPETGDWISNSDMLQYLDPVTGNVDWGRFNLDIAKYTVNKSINESFNNKDINKEDIIAGIWQSGTEYQKEALREYMEADTGMLQYLIKSGYAEEEAQRIVNQISREEIVETIPLVQKSKIDALSPYYVPSEREGESGGYDLARYASDKLENNKEATKYERDSLDVMLMSGEISASEWSANRENIKLQAIDKTKSNVSSLGFGPAIEKEAIDKALLITSTFPISHPESEEWQEYLTILDEKVKLADGDSEKLKYHLMDTDILRAKSKYYIEYPEDLKPSKDRSMIVAIGEITETLGEKVGSSLAYVLGTGETSREMFRGASMGAAQVVMLPSTLVSVFGESSVYAVEGDTDKSKETISSLNPLVWAPLVWKDIVANPAYAVPQNLVFFAPMIFGGVRAAKAGASRVRAETSPIRGVLSSALTDLGVPEKYNILRGSIGITPKSLSIERVLPRAEIPSASGAGTLTKITDVSGLGMSELAARQLAESAVLKLVSEPGQKTKISEGIDFGDIGEITEKAVELVGEETKLSQKITAEGTTFGEVYRQGSDVVIKDAEGAVILKATPSNRANKTIIYHASPDVSFLERAVDPKIKAPQVVQMLGEEGILSYWSPHTSFDFLARRSPQNPGVLAMEITAKDLRALPREVANKPTLDAMHLKMAELARNTKYYKDNNINLLTDNIGEKYFISNGVKRYVLETGKIYPMFKRWYKDGKSVIELEMILVNGDIVTSMPTPYTSGFKKGIATEAKTNWDKVYSKIKDKQNVVFDLDNTLINRFGDEIKGASDFVKKLKDEGKRVSLWTHSEKVRADYYVNRLGLKGIFDEIITRENYEPTGRYPEAFKDIKKIDGEILIDDNLQQKALQGNNQIVVGEMAKVKTPEGLAAAYTTTPFDIKSSSGKTIKQGTKVPVYYVATVEAVKAGRGVPSINSILTSNLYSYFGALRQLPYYRPGTLTLFDYNARLNPMRSTYEAFQLKEAKGKRGNRNTAVIENDKGEILLVRQKGQNRYDLPGGSEQWKETGKTKILKKPETEVEALIREVREETGLDVLDQNYLDSFVGRFEKDPNAYSVKFSVYDVKTRGTPKIKSSSEILEYSWWDKTKDYIVDPVNGERIRIADFVFEAMDRRSKLKSGPLGSYQNFQRKITQQALKGTNKKISSGSKLSKNKIYQEEYKKALDDFRRGNEINDKYTIRLSPSELATLDDLQTSILLEIRSDPSIYETSVDSYESASQKYPSIETSLSYDYPEIPSKEGIPYGSAEEQEGRMPAVIVPSSGSVDLDYPFVIPPRREPPDEDDDYSRYDFGDYELTTYRRPPVRFPPYEPPIEPPPEETSRIFVGKDEENEQEKIIPGTVTWRQGKTKGSEGNWYVWKPPYTQESLELWGQAPSGAKIVKGEDSAYLTIQSLRGPGFEGTKRIDAGAMDIVLSNVTGIGKLGAIRFEADPETETKSKITTKGVKLKKKRSKEISTPSMATIR